MNFMSKIVKQIKYLGRIFMGSMGKEVVKKYFGAGKRRDHFMRALEVVDLNGDGVKEIIVATKTVWVCAFHYEGHQLWQRHFESSVNCMDSFDIEAKLVVGLEDGSVFLRDGKGNIVKSGRLESAIQTILCNDTAVFVGSEKGVFEKFCIN